MKKIILITIFLALTGCFMKPYVVDIQQGNVIDTAAVQQLQMGMTKSQVQDILGAPVLAGAFDDDCWTYAYTYQKNGGKITKQILHLYFADDHLKQIQNN